MNTNQELKTFIAMDSATTEVEDSFLSKLGSAVKGAVAGATAGWKKGAQSSSASGVQKGKYGLSHPDGSPCDAKKPENCPVMRQQLKAQEAQKSKEDEKDKLDKSAPPPSSKTPTAPAKKDIDDDDRGGASFFPEDDEKGKQQPSKAEKPKKSEPKQETPTRPDGKPVDVAAQEKKELPASHPDSEINKKIRALTKKWGTAAQVNVDNFSALKKAKADGSSEQDIAYHKKNLHDSTLALSKIGHELDKLHKERDAAIEAEGGKDPK